jgi:hypothetical protein
MAVDIEHLREQIILIFAFADPLRQIGDRIK